MVTFSCRSCGTLEPAGEQLEITSCPKCGRVGIIRVESEDDEAIGQERIYTGKFVEYGIHKDKAKVIVDKGGFVITAPFQGGSTHHPYTMEYAVWKKIAEGHELYGELQKLDYARLLVNALITYEGG